MKIINEVFIKSASITGRSGINLDEYGYKKDETRLVCWVIDGVSPIIFKKKQKWKFRNFFYAGRYLNKILHQQEWIDLKQSFKKIASTILNSKHSNLYTKGPFFLRPLYSIGIVQIDYLKGIIRLGLYGDCVIIIKDGNEYSLIEYKKLELLKVKLDYMFNIMNTFLPNQLANILKKIIFSLIRFLQIYLGKYRVFSVKKDFGPAIFKTFDIKSVEKVYIMSDGVSWYFKDNAKKMKKLISIIEKDGVKTALSELRIHENDNVGFGNYDDATIMAIQIPEK